MEYDIHVLDRFAEILSRDHYEVMQYTNVNDKNNKSIYEGDIVNGAVFDTTICCGTIDFWNGGFWIHPIVKFTNWVPLHDWKGSIFVIGNIHQNPELLDSQPTIKKR